VKAQIWSLDFALSLLIFMSALFAMALAWNFISASTLQNQELKELHMKAMTLSDALIRTSGIPQDWNATNVQIIGLAQDENVLNATKVDYFTTMDYDRARALMDIGQYNFYFEVLDLNNTVQKNTTVPISDESVVVVPVERYAIYNDIIVKVKFVIWS